MNSPERVVVVCLANQCRSPMGEVLLADALAARGATSAFEVSSAGLEATPGMPATSAARRAVERRFGKDRLRGHRATRLDPATMAQADHILVMTRGQKAFLLDEWGAVVDGLDRKLKTLGEAAGKPTVDVDDPVGMPDERYDACLALLEALSAGAADALVDGRK